MLAEITGQKEEAKSEWGMVGGWKVDPGKEQPLAACDWTAIPSTQDQLVKEQWN